MLKTVISRLIRNKYLFPFWKFLNKISFYGMNYGVASGYANYSGELFIIKHLKHNLNDGVIFDVGANVGDWSKFFIKECSNINFKLHLFEPSKFTFKILKTNLDGNYKFHQIGFGDKNEQLKLFYDTYHQGNASILNFNSKKSELIQLKTIDTFCVENKISKIDFLKMDVQGFEYNILKGATKMLENNAIKFIQFEIDQPSIDNKVYFKDFWDILSEKYDLYQSLYNGIVLIKEYNYEMENFRCMNYLAILKRN